MPETNSLDAIAPAEIAARVESAGVAKAALATLPTLVQGGGGVLVGLVYWLVYRRSGGPGLL